MRYYVDNATIGYDSELKCHTGELHRVRDDRMSIISGRIISLSKIRIVRLGGGAEHSVCQTFLDNGQVSYSTYLKYLVVDVFGDPAPDKGGVNLVIHGRNRPIKE